MSAVAHPRPDKPTPPGSRPQLQVVDRPQGVDLARAERAVADLLAALGQDPSAEDLADTPRRVAAGLVVAVRPRVGGYLVAAWLTGIIANLLLLGGHGDVALRDLGLLLGALALARLATAFQPTPGTAKV